MNRNLEHIKSSLRKYYGAFGDGLLISPISKADLDIINELVELFKKIGVTEVVGVMNNFKLNPDEDVLGKLMELNIKGNKSLGNKNSEGKEDSDQLPYWIHLKDVDSNRILRFNLIHFKKVDAVGDKRDKWGIMLNETPDNAKTVPMHSNAVFIYDEEEDRDEDMKLLESLADY